ncbi:hypothetical protein DITRI_Ditri07aG0169400 [Diplodiscus trichospermus]
MEDGPNMKPSGTQGSLVTNKNTISYNDTMTRRLKNRERQRRYRARKRLEADMQKSRVLSQPTTPQVESQLKGILNNAMVRVHCKRDWKKDARQAHMCKGQEDTLNDSVQPSVIITAESQTPCLPSGIMAEGLLGRECHSENSVNLGNCETRKTKALRRTDSNNGRDCGNKEKDSMKFFCIRVDRIWSGNNSTEAYEQMAVVPSKKVKKGHRRLKTIDTTYRAVAFVDGDDGEPRLVRSCGMRRDWSFEDLRKEMRVRLIKKEENNESICMATNC